MMKSFASPDHIENMALEDIGNIALKGIVKRE